VFIYVAIWPWLGKKTPPLFSPPLHLRGFPPSVKVLFYDLQVDSDVKCQFIVFNCHITLTCYVEFTCENIIRISAGHYFHYFAIKLQIIQCLYWVGIFIQYVVICFDASRLCIIIQKNTSILNLPPDCNLWGGGWFCLVVCCEVTYLVNVWKC